MFPTTVSRYKITLECWRVSVRGHFVYPSPQKTLFGETASSNLFLTDEDKVRLIRICNATYNWSDISTILQQHETHTNKYIPTAWWFWTEPSLGPTNNLPLPNLRKLVVRPPLTAVIGYLVAISMRVTRTARVRGIGTRCKIPNIKFCEEKPEGIVGWFLLILTPFDIWCFVREPIYSARVSTLQWGQSSGGS